MIVIGQDAKFNMPQGNGCAKVAWQGQHLRFYRSPHLVMAYPRDPFGTPEPPSSQTNFQPYRDVPGHSNPDNLDYFDASAIPVSD